MRVLSLITLLAMLLTLFQSTYASYAAGDPIPMSKRSQYNGYTSGMSEVLFNDCPRYLYPRSLNWHSVIDAPNYESTKPFKIQLTFDKAGKFRTPWITVADGRGRYLATLVLKFRSDAGHIVGFSFETVYSREATKEIRIQHRWIVTEEDNIVAGVTTFMLVGFLAIFVLSSASISHWNSMTSTTSQEEKSELETFTDTSHFKGV